MNLNVNYDAPVYEEDDAIRFIAESAGCCLTDAATYVDASGKYLIEHGFTSDKPAHGEIDEIYQIGGEYMFGYIAGMTELPLDRILAMYDAENDYLREIGVMEYDGV